MGTVKTIALRRPWTLINTASHFFFTAGSISGFGVTLTSNGNAGNKRKDVTSLGWHLKTGVGGCWGELK